MVAPRHEIRTEPTRLGIRERCEMWTEARTSLTRMERAFNSLVSVSERAEELLLASRPAGGVWVVPDAVLRELAASLGIEIEVKELLDERLGPTT